MESIKKILKIISEERTSLSEELMDDGSFSADPLQSGASRKFVKINGKVKSQKNISPDNIKKGNTYYIFKKGSKMGKGYVSRLMKSTGFYIGSSFSWMVKSNKSYSTLKELLADYGVKTPKEFHEKFNSDPSLRDRVSREWKDGSSSRYDEYDMKNVSIVAGGLHYDDNGKIDNSGNYGIIKTSNKGSWEGLKVFEVDPKSIELGKPYL